MQSYEMSEEKPRLKRFSKMNKIISAISGLAIGGCSLVKNDGLFECKYQSNKTTWIFRYNSSNHSIINIKQGDDVRNSLNRAEEIGNVVFWKETYTYKDLDPDVYNFRLDKSTMTMKITSYTVGYKNIDFYQCRWR